jgi:CheY-like chemotaxis protein
VDDEDDVRAILADRFRAAGYAVTEAEDPDAALKAAAVLGRQRVHYVLVTDLGMPTSGGSSFQGGFEIVKRLWKMNQRPPVLMMTDSLSGALRARARQMGVAALVFKPGLSKLDPQQHQADLRAFADKLVADVLPRVAASGPGSRPPAPAAARVAADARPTPSAEMALLQRHLEALRRSADPTQVSTLVMRVAREFFERGILFLVKNEEVRGLAGFGPAPKGQSLALLVREVIVPLSEGSFLLDVVSRRKPWSGPLPDGRWSQQLIGKIGRFRAGEAALLPLLTHRETIALLYGDNPETGRSVGRLDVLEVFVNQAGVALENLFLQRKLKALQERE